MVPHTIYAVNTSPSATYTDVWSLDIVRAIPSVAVALGISSSSVEDDTDKGGATPGTGAFTVKVSGLDTNWAEISETKTMNGRTKVVTTALFLRVNSVEVLTAGTGETNAGTIYVYDTSQAITNGVPDSMTTKVFGVINIGESKSLMGMYSFPADPVYDPTIALDPKLSYQVSNYNKLPVPKTHAIGKVIASITDASGTARYGGLQVQVKEFGGVWVTYPIGNINTGVITEIAYKNTIKLPAKSEVRFQGTSSNASTTVNLMVEFVEA